MRDFTTAIIAGFLFAGVVVSIWIGLVLRAKKRCLGNLGALSLGFLVAIIAMLGAAYAQEICEKKLAICLGTTDTNVWNFVLFPALSLPVYWLLIAAVRHCGK